MRVLGIDPGLDTGWAIITDGQLTLAGLGSPKDLLPGRECFFHGPCYIECPRIYPTGTPNPNDIVTLAVMVGRYAEYIEARSESVTLVFPRIWKGQIPKTKRYQDYIVYKRMKTKYPNIDEFLRTIPDGLKHNTIDAVGIADYGTKG